MSRIIERKRKNHLLGIFDYQKDEAAKEQDYDDEGDEFSMVDEHNEDEKQIKCRKLPTLTHLKLCKIELEYNFRY